MQKSRFHQIVRFTEETCGHMHKLMRHQESIFDVGHGIRKAWKKRWREWRHFPSSKMHKLAAHYLNLGTTAYNAHNYSDAVRMFRKATDCDNTYARAYAYLGNALYMQNHMTEAISAWQSAIRIAPHSEVAHKAKEKLDTLGRGAGDVVTNLRSQWLNEQEALESKR